MQIEVPDALTSAVIGEGDPLAELRDCHAHVLAALRKREAARTKLESSFNPEVAQVLADGLARSAGSPEGETATMVVTEDGRLTVVVGASGVVQPAAQVAPVAQKSKKKKYPSIGELRVRAAACGVDISDLAPQAKGDILARIEAGEKKTTAAPPKTPATKTIAEPDPEPEPEFSLDEPGTETEDEELDVDEWLK